MQLVSVARGVGFFISVCLFLILSCLVWLVLELLATAWWVSLVLYP